jgi:asparagine synthase (glutamine-hydrolysing)
LSGIVGIFHRDGAPIESALLLSLVDFLTYRGPDAHGTWLGNSIGLGHTLLRTTRESYAECQPTAFEGRYWITADARLDGRAELQAALDLSESGDAHPVSDSGLILRAYAKWGSACVEHLRGDFSFAIWDAANRQLFCARDQFGIKPFYYASVDSVVVFSNTLECIRLHRAVSANLNDLAISDLLLFDIIREPGATSFADIHRLPPAHTLVCGPGGISVRRYWSLPVSAPLQHKRPGECVEQFRELLDRAVADRLRTDSAGVLMSGGLDSTTVAASAQRSLARNGSESRLCAYTEVFDSLIPHEERRYAELAAKTLEIPIQFHVIDGIGLKKPQNQEDSFWPEPMHSPGSDGGVAQLRQVAGNGRVALTGYGADPAFSSMISVHFLSLLQKKQFGRALSAAMRYLSAEGRLSRLYLRTRWQRLFAPKSNTPSYPGWLNRDLEKQLDLRERWDAATRSAPNAAVRPVAYEAMVDPLWPTLFEGYDPGITRVPVEVRHPFFDLRLVDFLLALPALPWCSDKELLREAGRGVLPDRVRLRRKSPLSADPLIVLLERPESAWVDSFEDVPALSRYVERRLVPKVFRERDVWSAWIHLRPLTLNYWLRSKYVSGINVRGVVS